MRVSYAFVLAFSIAAIDASAEQIIDATLDVVDSGNPDVEWHTENIVPYFRFIPGSISGNPVNDDILTATIDDRLHISKDLSTWNEKARNEALPLSESYIAAGVKIEPASARLLRVGTFAYDFDHEIGLSVWFEDTAQDGAIILLYVSEPCRIFGSLTYEDVEYSLDISLEEEGFHFVLSDPVNRIAKTEIEGQLIYRVTH